MISSAWVKVSGRPSTSNATSTPRPSVSSRTRSEALLVFALMTALAPRGVEPHHVEGLAQGRWVLLDYMDFVVHVFHPELRAFYQLERLWGDAPVVAAGDSGATGAKG